MSDKEQFPTQTLTAILSIAVTLAAGFVAYQPLRSLRQEAIQQTKLIPIENSQVLARLWDDPLLAVEEHRRNEMASVMSYEVQAVNGHARGPLPSGVSRSSKAVVRANLFSDEHHSIESLIGHLTAGGVKPRVKVVITTLIGSPYAEDNESLIRAIIPLLTGTG